MSTEEPPFSASAMSALDKPLHQLTEDDISQLTREDCRRYLKQKGMRRPSWNKSQAIQQVIMLKKLLEPDSEDGNRKLYITSRQQQTPTTRVQKGTSADTEISLSAEESVAGHRNDTEKSDFLGDNDSAPPPGMGGVSVTEEAKGQMTIFYSGKVNVYDDVPTDKARVLLQLAATPHQFPHEDPLDGNIFQQPPPILQTVRMTDNYRETNILREENSGEGSASRKASVQRYLEKRKDRFKSKRKGGGAPPCGGGGGAGTGGGGGGGFDVYVNHQIGNQNNNVHEQSSRSATCSPPPVRPPNTPNRFS